MHCTRWHSIQSVCIYVGLMKPCRTYFTQSVMPRVKVVRLSVSLQENSEDWTCIALSRSYRIYVFLCIVLTLLNTNIPNRIYWFILWCDLPLRRDEVWSDFFLPLKLNISKNFVNAPNRKTIQNIGWIEFMLSTYNVIAKLLYVRFELIYILWKVVMYGENLIISIHIHTHYTFSKYKLHK